MKNKDYTKVIKYLVVLNIVMILLVILSYCAKTKDYSEFKMNKVIEYHRGISKK